MLFVKTEELQNFGDYLINLKVDLDELLADLDTQMSQITTAWKDAQGADFVLKFNNFVKEAAVISTEINSLGSYAKSISANYNKILTEALNKMGE